LRHSVQTLLRYNRTGPEAGTDGQTHSVTRCKTVPASRGQVIRPNSTNRCYIGLHYINPLDSKGNYSATSNNTKLVHWPLMVGLLHLVQRGGAWTVLLYDGPLLYTVLMWRLNFKGLILVKTDVLTISVDSFDFGSL